MFKSVFLIILYVVVEVVEILVDGFSVIVEVGWCGEGEGIGVMYEFLMNKLGDFSVVVFEFVCECMDIFFI